MWRPSACSHRAIKRSPANKPIKKKRYPSERHTNLFLVSLGNREKNKLVIMSDPEKAKKIACSVMSIWLSAFIYVKSDDYLGEKNREWNEACNNFDQLNMADWVKAHGDGYRSYEENWGFVSWGKVLVCTNTQLFYDLIFADASALMCITLALIALPLMVSIILEAGRKDANGLFLTIPLAFWLLIQQFSMPLAFPLFWLPSYFFARGTGSIAPARIFASLPMAALALVLTILVFYLDPRTQNWGSCVAFLGGPAICMTPTFIASIQHPDDSQGENIEARKKRSRKLTAFIYGITGIICLLTWIWLIFLTVIPKHGFDAPAVVFKAVWTEARPTLKVKTLEALTLWLSGVLFIGFQNMRAGVEAFFLSFFFGPGAALSLALAGVAVDDDKVDIDSSKEKKE